MNSDQLNEVALAIYRRVQRNADVPKSTADECGALWTQTVAANGDSWRKKPRNAIAIVNAGPAKERIWRGFKPFRSFL